ncbi:MAG: prepilin-type N-terminal cleavage/methylation domain-containing protein [Candidatus Falkowbacteria bacterium]
MKKNQQGFTLIELLVVIAIIGLLSTLSIVALNQARARSRDARRIADVKQIQTALEMYYNDLGQYPTSLTAGSNISSSTVVYMDIVPKPPLPADNAACSNTILYTYTPTTIGGVANGTYTLAYCLGSNTGGIPSGLNTASPSGIGLRSIP